MTTCSGDSWIESRICFCAGRVPCSSSRWSSFSYRGPSRHAAASRSRRPQSHSPQQPRGERVPRPPQGDRHARLPRRRPGVPEGRGAGDVLPAARRASASELAQVEAASRTRPGASPIRSPSSTRSCRTRCWCSRRSSSTRSRQKLTDESIRASVERNRTLLQTPQSTRGQAARARRSVQPPADLRREAAARRRRLERRLLQRLLRLRRSQRGDDHRQAAEGRAGPAVQPRA